MLVNCAPAQQATTHWNDAIQFINSQISQLCMFFFHPLEMFRFRENCTIQLSSHRLICKTDSKETRIGIDIIDKIRFPTHSINSNLFVFCFDSVFVFFFKRRLLHRHFNCSAYIIVHIQSEEKKTQTLSAVQARMIIAIHCSFQREKEMRCVSSADTSFEWMCHTHQTNMTQTTRFYKHRLKYYL